MHIIHQIRIESRAGSEKLARKVDRAIAFGLDDEIQRQLGPCLDEVCGDLSLRIDKLEIDLGELCLEDLERGFAKRVAAAVVNELRSVAPSDCSIGGSGRLSGIPLERERLDAWLHFMRHGHLPWWFAVARWQEIESVSMLHEQFPVQLEPELRRLAKSAPMALIRLARHEKTEDLVEVFGNLERAGGTGSGTRKITGFHVIARWLAGQDFGNEVAARMLPHVSSLEQAEFESVWGIETDSLETTRRASKDVRMPEGGQSEERSEAIDFADATGVSSFSCETNHLEMGLPVETAGLVLLHPFLGRFFGQFGWLDDAGRMDSRYRWHCVQALQFLARGKCGLPEATLVLEKMLCGIPVEHPAEIPSLDEDVRTECGSLLNAVIVHWSALGRTSVEGLRESFLMRRGLLAIEEDRSVLSVERQPYDMLLTRLPWPLGPVMFRWLERPVYVRWQGGQT